MKRLTGAVLCFVAASGVAGADAPILPFDQVRAGMKATGRTVFSGTKVETFDVEILGRLPHVGPDQNLILGRCSGGPLAHTGVLAGMSGSPVFVDGKIIGAISYAWGFAKDAIAGITPIEEMLAAGARGARAGERSRRPAALAPADLARLGSFERMSSFVTADLPRRIFRSADHDRAAIPLSVSGLGSAGVARIESGLARAGLQALQGGGAGGDAAPTPRPEPGSAVGLKLVRGDVDMTATGTLTWIDGNDVLAFGHPLFGLGDVALPLSGARVEALVPTLERSLRLATPLTEIGTILQDRNAAVAGRLGAPPRMIPVRLRLSLQGGAGGGAADGEAQGRTYAFDLADDPLLAPLLLYTSVRGILAGRERVEGNVTLRLLEGSVIKMKGQDDVEVDNLFSGSSAPYYATAMPAFLLYLLLNNDLRPPQVEGINLILEYHDEPRTARLRRVLLDRYRAHPGDDVEATIVLSPFRGDDLVLRHTLHVPEETPAGPLVLDFGDALALNRSEAGDTPPLPRELAHLVALINRVPRNDRVYITASREDAGVFVDGARLPNLPPSASAILTRPKSRGNFALAARRNLVEERIPVDHEVEGNAQVKLEVEAR